MAVPKKKKSLNRRRYTIKVTTKILLKKNSSLKKTTRTYLTNTKIPSEFFMS